MVCQHSALCDPEASGLIERELSHLFGPVVAAECWNVPTAIEAGQARRVAHLADSLLSASGPREQRALVQATPLADQLLLCRWLADRKYVGNLLSKGK